MWKAITLNQRLFDLPILRGLGRSIHARRAARDRRILSTSTRFFRTLTQFQALRGPLAQLTEGPSEVRILVAACSFGCEAYSLAGYLAVESPQARWTIDAFDISPEAVAVAQRGVYGAKHGLAESLESEARPYAERLFERHGDQWTVVADIRERVRVWHGDLLADDFVANHCYELVLAQNVLLHLDDAAAAEAFARVVGAIKPGGALFVGGMDLDSKVALIKRHDLIPVDWKIKTIHDSDEVRRSAWPWGYWTLEPIDASQPDFTVRYSTIFRTHSGPQAQTR